MTPLLISVTNHSATVLDVDVTKVVRDITVQLTRDVAPIWGLVPALEFVPKGQKANGIPCTISDKPDVPGAAGYHDTNGIKVFVIPGMDWRTTLSHEILELLGDAPANKWADGPNGDDYAFELCDAVEGDVYDITGTPVSNFVYPAFFDPTAAPTERLDHMGNLSAPFGMTAGGYQIRRTEPGRVSQIFAQHSHNSAIVAGTNLVLVFGPDFPDSKRAGKLANAKKKRGI